MTNPPFGLHIQPKPAMEETKTPAESSVASHSLPKVGIDDSSDASSDGVLDVWVANISKKRSAGKATSTANNNGKERIPSTKSSPTASSAKARVVGGSSSAAPGTSSRWGPPPVAQQPARPTMNPVKTTPVNPVKDAPVSPVKAAPIHPFFSPYYPTSYFPPPGPYHTSRPPFRNPGGNPMVPPQRSSAASKPPSTGAKGSGSVATPYPGRQGPSSSGPNTWAPKLPISASKPRHSNEDSSRDLVPGTTSRTQKQFTSKMAAAPLRFPPDPATKNKVSTIPDDSEDHPPKNAEPVPDTQSKRPRNDEEGQWRLPSEVKPERFSERQAKRSRTPQTSETVSTSYGKSYSYTYRAENDLRVENRTRLRLTRVEEISQWNFSKSTNNLRDTVYKSLRNGQDAPVVEVRVFPNARKRKVKVTNGTKKKKPYPEVTQVEFDSRFFQWDKSPLGSLDILVRKPVILAGKGNLEPVLQKVPDSLPPSKTASRIGKSYQARIPHFEQTNKKRKDNFLPDFSTLWDPVMAQAAERRGEDIDSFLNQEPELSKKEILMELLHRSCYSVTLAQREYDRLKAHFGDEPSCRFKAEEMAKLKRLVSRFGKDYRSISSKMKRSRADCMINYYRWKRTNKQSYVVLKKQWKSDYCAVCDDGGDLLVCDGCEHAYHPGCLDPPLKKVPEGDWFCAFCKNKKEAPIARPPPSVRNSGKVSSPALNFNRHVSPSRGVRTVKEGRRSSSHGQSTSKATDTFLATSTRPSEAVKLLSPSHPPVSGWMQTHTAPSGPSVCQTSNNFRQNFYNRVLPNTDVPAGSHVSARRVPLPPPFQPSRNVVYSTSSQSVRNTIPSSHYARNTIHTIPSQPFRNTIPSQSVRNSMPPASVQPVRNVIPPSIQSTMNVLPNNFPQSGVRAQHQTPLQVGTNQVPAPMRQSKVEDVCDYSNGLVTI